MWYPHAIRFNFFFLAFWQFFSYSQNFIFEWFVKRGEGGYLKVSLYSKLLSFFIHTMTCFSIICTNLWWELKTISELMLPIDLPTSYSKEQSTVTRSCNSGYQLREPLDLLTLDSLTWEALNNIFSYIIFIVYFRMWYYICCLWLVSETWSQDMFTSPVKRRNSYYTHKQTWTLKNISPFCTSLLILCEKCFIKCKKNYKISILNVHTMTCLSIICTNLW